MLLPILTRGYPKSLKTGKNRDHKTGRFRKLYLQTLPQNRNLLSPSDLLQIPKVRDFFCIFIVSTVSCRSIGKPRKNDPNAENIPPPTVSSSPLTGDNLPTPPVSPSKRKSNNEPVEGSPSKKRGGVLRPFIPDNERGRLFTMKRAVSVSDLVSKMNKPILSSSSDGELENVF